MLGKWQLSITDLEMAANGVIDPKIHEWLAMAYRGIGNESLAETHHQMAERMQH